MNDLRPRLCSRPEECRCTTQHAMRPACPAALPRQPPTQRFAASPASAWQGLGSAPAPPLHRITVWVQPGSHNRTLIMAAETALQGPINVANLWVNQWSQINEYTMEPSLAAQDINPITYVPDPIFAPPYLIRTRLGPAD